MKHKKRELDSVTPDFTLSQEDIADLKRILTDKEYAEERRKEQEAEEVMEILNQVEGVQDTYEGLGGTEAEVEGILDEILGNE